MVSLKSRKQKRCSPNYVDSGHSEKIETGSLCYFNSMPIYGALVYSKYWPIQVGRYQKHEKNLFSILKVFITTLIQNKSTQSNELLFKIQAEVKRQLSFYRAVETFITKFLNLGIATF